MTCAWRGHRKDLKATLATLIDYLAPKQAA